MWQITIRNNSTITQVSVVQVKLTMCIGNFSVSYAMFGITIKTLATQVGSVQGLVWAEQYHTKLKSCVILYAHRIFPHI